MPPEEHEPLFLIHPDQGEVSMPKQPTAGVLSAGAAEAGEPRRYISPRTAFTRKLIPKYTSIPPRIPTSQR